MIEVERKFVLPPDAIERLQRERSLIDSKKSIINDIYYDVESHKLMCHDVWLRQRNGRWQLKSKPPDTSNTSSTIKPSDSRHGLTEYVETEDEHQILPLLLTLVPDLSIDRSVREEPLATLVAEGVLLPVINFQTQRHTFSCGKITVDLDETDFGFHVGEIEIVVQEEKDVPEAVRSIEEFANSLGLSEWTGTGKINAYLTLYNKPLFSLLTRAGVLHDSVMASDHT